MDANVVFVCEQTRQQRIAFQSNVLEMWSVCELSFKSISTEGEKIINGGNFRWAFAIDNRIWVRRTSRVMFCPSAMNNDRNGLLSIVYGLDYVSLCANGVEACRYATLVFGFGRGGRHWRCRWHSSVSDETNACGHESIRTNEQTSMMSMRRRIAVQWRIRLQGGVGFNKLPLGNRNRNH